MGSVTIGTDTFTVFGSLAAATSYNNGSILARARWNAAGDDTKKAALIEATRFMADLPWRDGVTPGNVQAIVEATYTLAACYVVKPGGMGGIGGGSATDGVVQQAQDTTRRVSFYFSSAQVRAKSSPQDALYRDLYAKVRPYLRRGAAGVTAGIAFASGTDGESQFTDDKRLTLKGDISGNNSSTG